MKLLTRTISVIAVALTITLFANCDDKDSPTAQETQLKKLSAKTWSIQSVEIDGVDHTALFQGMTLSITKNSFSATNGGDVWPASGTWEFADERATLITRGDNVSITIEVLADSQLSFSLAWNETTFGPGRGKSISGTHVFNFN